MDIEIKNVGKLRVHSNLNHFVTPILDRILNYKCDSCGKAFSIAGYLTKHINSVHNAQN